MNEGLQIVFGLLGGLAIFIFGMNMMSESLQKAAGERMRTILGVLTKNPLMGVLAGTLATAVLQSSSATTVMVIGFVSAGLMALKQGISVILGANIGTTLTAQLLAFNISDYIFMIIFTGFIMSFVIKKESIRNIGNTIFAFGLLFEGIEIMGTVMKPLAESPVFIDMIEQVADIPVLGVGVGTLMTLIVQSSSATIAVLQNFAEQAGPDGISSVIGLEGAIPILLGDNIGTTITAVLACIGQSRAAKCTALAHCLFNLSGAFLFIWMIKPYAAFIEFISTKGPEVEVIARQIANAHSLFNITMTIIWLPLIGVMVWIVTRIIPEGRSAALEKGNPVYLDDRMIGQPAAALEMVAREIIRCGNQVNYMLGRLNRTIKMQDPAVLKKLKEDHEDSSKLYGTINDYLANMFSSGALTEEQANQTAGMIYVLSDIERTDNLCMETAGILHRNIKQKRRFSDQAVKDLSHSLSIVEEMYKDSITSLKTGDRKETERIYRKKEKVLEYTIKIRKEHVRRIGEGDCRADMSSEFTGIIHNLERMSNSCVNMADAVMTEVDFRTFFEEKSLKEAREGYER